MPEIEMKYKLVTVIQSVPARKSILSAACICQHCGWQGQVYDAVPNVDGEGSLGCPECHK